MSTEATTEVTPVESATPVAPETTKQEQKPAEKPYSALRAALGIRDTKPEKKPEEKTEPEKEKPVEKKPVEKKEAANPEPEPEPEVERKVKRVPKTPQVVKLEGADELKEATKNLTQAAADIRNAAKPQKVEEVQLELPEEIDLDEIKALEELDPKKFKDLEVKARQFWGKGGAEDKYIAAWEKENPGQKFDAEAPEHASFYEKNEPFVTDAERKSAQRHIGAKIAERRAEEAARKVTEPVQRQMARERAEKAADPQRTTWEQDLIKAAVEIADPEMKGADVSKLADEHPVLHGIVSELHESVKPAISELFALKNGAPFDAKNPVHTALFGVAEQLQGQILELPESEREVPILNKSGKVVGYKSFLPMNQFHTLPKDQQANHWTVTEDTILGAIQNDIRSGAAQKYKAKADEIAKYGGTVKRKVSPKKAEREDSKQEDQSDSTEAESSSVEASASAPTPTPTSESDGDNKNKYPNLRRGLGIL